MSRKQIHAPKVKIDPVMEAIAKKLSGIDGVKDISVKLKMIREAAKAARKAAMDELLKQQSKKLRIINSDLKSERKETRNDDHNS